MLAFYGNIIVDLIRVAAFLRMLRGAIARAIKAAGYRCDSDCSVVCVFVRRRRRRSFVVRRSSSFVRHSSFVVVRRRSFVVRRSSFVVVVVHRSSFVVVLSRRRSSFVVVRRDDLPSPLSFTWPHVPGRYTFSYEISDTGNRGGRLRAALSAEAKARQCDVYLPPGRRFL